MGEDQGTSSGKRVLVFLSLGILFAILICAGTAYVLVQNIFFVNIEPDERAVVFSPYESSGFRSEVLEPGRHFLRLGEEILLIDISDQVYEMTASSGEKPDSIEATTSDDIEVLADISIRYAVNPDYVLQLFIHWQDRYQSEFIRPISRGITRDVIGEYSYQELMQSREEIQARIYQELGSKLEDEFIILHEVILIAVDQAGE